MTAAALPRPSDRFIPLYIVAFFAVFMTVLLTMVYISLRSYPGIVTENSYEKGLAMNKYIAASAAQQALGWKGDLVVGPWFSNRLR